MFRNVGNIDKALRILLGLGLLSLFFFGPRTAWGLLGVIPLLTGVAGSCPIYGVFGFSTRRRTRHQGH